MNAEQRSSVPYIVALLLVVALLALLARDPALCAASLVLVPVALGGRGPVLAALQAYSFPVGMFFLLVFLMLPIVAQKVAITDVPRLLLSPIGLVAVAAGALVSWIGGRGVNLLAGRPALLPGLVVGTLLSVSFLRGLPAGLIVAAGFLALLGVAS